MNDDVLLVANFLLQMQELYIDCDQASMMCHGDVIIFRFEWWEDSIYCTIHKSMVELRQAQYDILSAILKEARSYYAEEGGKRRI